MVTRYLIGEQVRSRLNGGDAKAASWADIREIYKAIEQVVNSALKMEAFKVILPAGETIPDGLSVATYVNVPVVPYMGTARARLPAMPTRLVRNMGVWAIGPMNLDGDTILNSQFIPVGMGQSFFLQSQPMISDLLGQVGYEPSGLDILFLSDITKAPNNITQVWMKLIVLDISQYGDFDILPIPADMEADVIEQVYARFAPEPAPDKIVDPIALTQKTVK